MATQGGGRLVVGVVAVCSLDSGVGTLHSGEVSKLSMALPRSAGPDARRLKWVGPSSEQSCVVPPGREGDHACSRGQSQMAIGNHYY
jgi:hypothetical protein